MQVILMYFITHVGLIFFMYPTDIIESASRTHWVPIFIGMVFHLVFIWIYMKGLSYFPGKNIIDIYMEKGKGLSLIFLIPIIGYFFLANITTVRAYSEIINIVFLSETPLWATMIPFLFIATYIAAKGINVIFHTAFIVACVFLPLFLFIFILSFQNVDWRYFFPLFDIDYSFISNRSYYKSFFSFAGVFLFLGFIQPYHTYDRKKVFLSAILLLPFFLFSVYVPILTFGQATSATFQFPFVTALDSVYISWLVFDRITMFFLISLLIFIMIFLSLLLWMVCSILVHFVPIVKHSYVLYFLSILIFIICVMLPDWKVVENLFWWNTYFRFYVILVIPFSVLIFGVRSKRKVR
ncbi:GerAB/ArcD/ProY family transporter [Gracilibacillus salitolerans]|uniref:GerAB/ArcD/ProY family transporter n=1 Tax=Gracilibacillus salitolerans TaxID=2663022 RepID=A0A5Q2TH90_9BACI|nr:GerAB/ArcD/ProY family transporter [Gracilibacillus salitolerans]